MGDDLGVEVVVVAEEVVGSFDVGGVVKLVAGVVGGFADNDKDDGGHNHDERDEEGDEDGVDFAWGGAGHGRAKGVGPRGEVGAAGGILMAGVRGWQW